MTKNETLVSHEKALAILASCDALGAWVDGQSYYLVTDDDGTETLVGYGEEQPVATNYERTSWHSPGYPELPSFGDGDYEWVTEEIDRIEAEVGCELEPLHVAGGASLRDRAKRLAGCDDPPAGENGKLVAAILAD